MNKKYLLAGSLAFYLLLARGQHSDKKEADVSKTDIELVYNHYLQDGDNSAITGGEGTERLTVYGPAFSLKQTFGKNQIGFQLGSDVISSASTDNIDSVESSASRLDARTYTDVNYSRGFSDNRLRVTAGVNFSIESDYFSFGKYLGADYTSKDGLRTLSANIDVYNDDLRWGRLEDGFLEAPMFLIYPGELRYQEWYDEFRRNSYNLNLGISQIIDKRNVVGVFGLFSLQDGLLATPFHRIFFTDGSRAVELLPNERYKGAITAKWNTFLGGNIILKNSISGYSDSFGITGFSIENETAFKLDSRWTMIPGIRWYAQGASRHFRVKGAHSRMDEFYTSDYDLSKFTSTNIGLSIKHTPISQDNKGNQEFKWRYNYFGRSNRLTTHSLSFSVQFRSFGKRKK